MPSQRAINKASHAFKKLLETQGPDAAQAALDKRGGQVPPQQKTRAQGMINQARKNMGGPVMGYNMGGMISEEEKRRRMMMQPQVAQSRVGAAPLAAKQGMQPAQTGGGGGPLQQVGQMMAKQALMSTLGPVGALFGFNKGGKVHNNPHGYNEGGAVGETPIKKVMDEQKLEQQAKAFELEQQRKQQTHEQAMRIKEQQAKQAAAMKKAAANTSKQPAKPKGPLGG